MCTTLARLDLGMVTGFYGGREEVLKLQVILFFWSPETFLIFDRVGLARWASVLG